MRKKSKHCKPLVGTQWSCRLQKCWVMWRNKRKKSGRMRQSESYGPCVWSMRPFPRCQMQETLARDVFSFARFGIMWGFFSGLRPALTDSVCARTFLYLCPVLKPAQMQDSQAQTNWAHTNAGLTRTNGHSAPDSAVSTHNYALIVGRILQTLGREWLTINTLYDKNLAYLASFWMFCFHEFHARQPNANSQASWQAYNPRPAADWFSFPNRTLDFLPLPPP